MGLPETNADAVRLVGDKSLEKLIGQEMLRDGRAINGDTDRQAAIAGHDGYVHLTAVASSLIGIEKEVFDYRFQVLRICPHREPWWATGI